jgi:O-succinylbenzoate synthase
MSGDGEAGGAGEGVPVAALLPAGRAALAVAGSRVEAGFRTFKWKVGVADARDELGLLDDLLAVLPAGARLRLDANGAWDRRAAERWLGRCAELPLVEFVEQPVAAAPLPPPLAAGGGGGGAGVGRGRAREVDLLLGLAGDFPVPLALDESVVGARDVARWLDAGWPGLFVLKPSLLGDVAGTLARLRAADGGAQGGGSGGGEGSGGGGRVVFSSALETVVGARAALGWALSWEAGQGRAGGVEKGARTKPARRAAGFGVWPLFEDARFDGPAAAPFARAEDVRRLDGEAAWNALR